MDELICSLALFILCVSQQGNLTHKFKSHMYLFPREDSSLGFVPRYMKEENEMKRAELPAALLVVSSLLLLFVISPLFRIVFPSFLLVVSPVLLVVVPPLPHHCRCLALLLLVVLSSCSSSSCHPAILLLFVLSVLVVFFFLLPVVLPSCSPSSCLSSSSFHLVPRRLVSSSLSSEFFTVPHVFLPESTRIRPIPGIPRNGILAVLPAKIAISVPRNSGRFRNGHGITKMELTGTESLEFFLIVIVIFKSNTNYLIVITVNY